MDGKKQSFFSELRKLAADLDRGVTWCKNPTFDYQDQAKCLNYLKAYEEEIQEKLVESKSLYEEQESSLLNYERLFGLVDAVVDQQKEILEMQENYMEQYGYVPYEKCFPAKEENTEEEPEIEAEAASTPEKNPTPENMSEVAPVKEESPQTPKLEDYKLSHYTLVQLQSPKVPLNQPTMERIATPKVFQHDGLFMSPGVWGQMPPLYTPDVMNSSTSCSFRWPGSAASTTQNNTSVRSKEIRKNLQREMNMNTEDQDILNQCPRWPALNSVTLQNLSLEMYQLPETPQSATRPTPRTPADFIVSKSKDYLNKDLPQPPKLNPKFQSLFHDTSIKVQPKLPSEVPLSVQNTKRDLSTPPPPPLLHSAFSNLDEMDVAAESVLSCKKSKKKKLNYFDIDIPRPPELTGVYDFSTSDKENFHK